MRSPATAMQIDDVAGRAGFVLVGCLCGGLSLAGIVITLSSPIVDHPALYASLRGLLTFGLLAVGLAGWAREPGGRYPALVLIFCCLFALTSLTGVNDPWPFAVGRVVVAGMITVVAYLFLSYPSGRLEDPAAIVLVQGLAAGTAVWLGLTLLLSSSAPVAGTVRSLRRRLPAQPARRRC